MSLFNMRFNSKLSSGLLIFTVCFVFSVRSQTVNWTGLGDGQVWSDDANWDVSAPSSGYSVIINQNPVDNLMAPGYGAGLALNSLTFGASINASITLTVGVAGDLLQISSGGLTNLGAFVHQLNAPITAASNATWDGPFSYSSLVNIDTRSITLEGTHVFTSATINFDITNLSTFGRFLGSGTSSFSGVTINIGGAYTGGVAGNSFDFTSGSFFGATLGVLPTLSNGLVWDDSNFLSQGVLTVSAVPEPSTYAAIVGIAALGFCAVRRRRKA